MSTKTHRLTQLLTGLLLAGLILFQGTAYGGPIKKRGFDKKEKAGLEQRQAQSKEQTSRVRGESGDRLITPGRVLLVAGIVGIGVLAANADWDTEDECLINGQRIDSNSAACRNAVRHAEDRD